MAYYDALIAKWPSLTGASASSELVSAAQAALATPLPAVPAYPGADASPADAAAYVAALAAETAAQQARQEAYAAPFYDPATLAKLAQLNAITSNGAQSPVDIAAAVGYLREQSAWLPIKASTNPAALAVVDLYDDPRAQTLDFTLPIVGELMTALVGAGLLTQAQADALQAMSFQIPWWQTVGYASPISPSDLEAVFVQSGGATVLV